MEAEKELLEVLVVEDQVAVACALLFVLKHAGHKAEWAHNGCEALQKIKAAPSAFDLMITDNNMPVMDGIALVREIRTLPFQGRIVVISAYLSSEVEETYRGLGVRHFIHKPFDLPELRAVLDELSGELAAEPLA
jgi:CheY-like chemotaxis protein